MTPRPFPPAARASGAASRVHAAATDGTLPKRWYNLDSVLTDDFPHR